MCVDYIFDGQFHACGHGPAPGIFFSDIYPIALAKADPLTGRRYTRAELKAQFERKIRAKGLDPDDVLRQYYACIDKVIEEAGIQHVPRFAYGQAAFDHLQERGVGVVRRIMHPEGAKNLSHGEAAKIMEAVANGEEAKNFFGIPGLPLCEESDASTSELFSILWDIEISVMFYVDAFNGQADAINALRELQSKAQKAFWEQLSTGKKIRRLSTLCAVDADAFFDAMQVELKDDAALEELDYAQFRTFLGVHIKAAWDALPESQKIRSLATLNKAGADFARAYGVDLADDEALAGIGYAAFKSFLSQFCKDKFAALPESQKIRRLATLHKAGAAFSDAFGVDLDDDEALAGLDYAAFKSFLSQFCKDKFAALPESQKIRSLATLNKAGADFARAYGVDLADDEALAGIGYAAFKSFLS
ncbi:hypothetical protein AURANDRAFT_68923, partial [Aureococcus anophagefferens]